MRWSHTTACGNDGKTKLISAGQSGANYLPKVSVYEMLDERPRVWFDHISRFARTVDREFLVLNGSQKLVETLALVDTMLAAQQYFTAFAGGRQPATKPDR